MSNNIDLKRGLDIPITGTAAQKTKKVVKPDVVAVKPTDFRGLLPRLLVREGDKVLAGSPVLADKKSPEILFTSPVSGTVTEIVRGEKRKLLEVRIKADESQEYVDFGSRKVAGMSTGEIKEALLKSGLWPAFIQRPYGIIADPEIRPKAIFVSAFTTAALRNAKNSEEAVAKIIERTGINLHIISGDQEATYDFIAATHELDYHDGFIIDIGGASTELIRFADNKIIQKTSLPIGSLALHTKYATDFLPSEDEIAQMIKEVHAIIDTAPEFKDISHAEICGIGGTCKGEDLKPHKSSPGRFFMISWEIILLYAALDPVPFQDTDKISAYVRVYDL